MAWLTIVLLLLGGFTGYALHRPRILLGALLLDLVALAVAHDQDVHWLIVTFSILVPVLAAAFVGAVVRHWVTRSSSAAPARRFPLARTRRIH